MKTVRVGKVVFGSPKSLPLIAGPCVIESEKSALRHAEKISKVARSLGVPFVFKASYDKANRTSVSAFRGLGLEKGLKILSKVKKEFKIPVLSDVHSIEEVGPASEVLDIMQIPAFLCRRIRMTARGNLWPAQMKRPVQFIHRGCRTLPRLVD